MHDGNDCMPRVYEFLSDMLNFPDREFKTLRILGKGSYASVTEALELGTGRIVSVKEILLAGDEASLTSARSEIKILTHIRSSGHPNLPVILGVYKTNGTFMNIVKPRVHLVLEYHPHVLRDLISHRSEAFGPSNAKSAWRQLLVTLDFLHDRNIFHRDLKPENVFVSKEGRLVLGDFGLADFFSGRDGRYEKSDGCVASIWYRPPEILLGATHYGPEVDLWSVGCLCAELFRGRALLPGSDGFAQLELISSLCGDLVPRMWPGVEQLPLYQALSPRLLAIGYGERSVKERLRRVTSDEAAKDLLSRLLVAHPTSRITAKRALEHFYFSTPPLPSDFIALE